MSPLGVKSPTFCICRRAITAVWSLDPVSNRTIQLQTKSRGPGGASQVSQVPGTQMPIVYQVTKVNQRATLSKGSSPKLGSGLRASLSRMGRVVTPFLQGGMGQGQVCAISAAGITTEGTAGSVRSTGIPRGTLRVS